MRYSASEKAEIIRLVELAAATKKPGGPFVPCLTGLLRIAISAAPPARADWHGRR
jgi:hypothetical protein